MVLWLYAFADSALPEPAPPGATGEVLAAHPIPAAEGAAGQLAVIAGEVAAPLRPDESNLRSHERTVRALAAGLDPLLPVRFGQWVDAANELGPLLAPRRAAFLAALARVDGCRQVTLRLMAPAASTGEEAAEVPDRESSGPSAGPGTRYLEDRRRAALTAVPEPARPLLEALAHLVRGERRSVAPAPYAATVYHLVEVSRLDDYLATLESMGAAAGGHGVAGGDGAPAVVWSGPWPPWAFAPGLAG